MTLIELAVNKHYLGKQFSNKLDYFQLNEYSVKSQVQTFELLTFIIFIQSVADMEFPLDLPI